MFQKNVMINLIAVNPSTGYINDFKSNITSVNDWYPLVLTSLLSVFSVVAILGFLLKKL